MKLEEDDFGCYDDNGSFYISMHNYYKNYSYTTIYFDSKPMEDAIYPLVFYDADPGEATFYTEAYFTYGSGSLYVTIANNGSVTVEFCEVTGFSQIEISGVICDRHAVWFYAHQRQGLIWA